jgi:NTP pyrophosphatase (non-canonical NTP hydrolase)
MSTFDGTGKPSWESFIYQFERTANRRHWRNRRKTGRLLDCLKDIALECARKVNKDDDYDSLRMKIKDLVRNQNRLLRGDNYNM